jgi:hypothetical protein
MVPPAGLAITADPGIARHRVSTRNPENPAKIFSSFSFKFLSNFRILLAKNLFKMFSII